MPLGLGKSLFLLVFDAEKFFEIFMAVKRPHIHYAAYNTMFNENAIAMYVTNNDTSNWMWQVRALTPAS